MKGCINPTVKEIVGLWLKEHGYSGLYSDNCGCEIGDLFCCYDNGGCIECKAGYRRILTKRVKAMIAKSDNYPDGMYEIEVGDWYITAEKPRRRKTR